MKYATLYKGLSAKREKCLAAMNKGGWYEKEKAEIEAKYKAALEALEKRREKSGASHADEVAALDKMLAILDGLMPQDDHMEEPRQMVEQQNEQAATSTLDGLIERDLPPPAFLKREEAA